MDEQRADAGDAAAGDDPAVGHVSVGGEEEGGGGTLLELHTLSPIRQEERVSEMRRRTQQ